MRILLLTLYHAVCAAASLAAIALLVAHQAAPALLERHKPEIEARLADVFGAPGASIGGLSVEANLSGLFLRIDDVSVAGAEPGAAAFGARRILAGIPADLLLGRRPQFPPRIALVGPRLTVAREADGAFSVAGMRPRPGMVSSGWGALAGAHYALRDAEITLRDDTGEYPELRLRNIRLDAAHRAGEFVVAMRADSPYFTGATLHARIDERTIGSPAKWDGSFRVRLDNPSVATGALRWANGSLRAAGEGIFRDGRVRAEFRGELARSELSVAGGSHRVGSGSFEGALEIGPGPAGAPGPRADLSVDVDLEEVRVVAPMVMHRPVALSGLQGRLTLGIGVDGWRAGIGHGRASAPGASAVFSVSAQGSASEVFDVRLTTRATGPVAARDSGKYLPTAVDEAVAAWLGTAIVGGTLAGIDVTLRGHPADFPYASGESGVFRMAFAFEGADFDYWPGWPGISGADGTLLFSDKRMACVLDQGRIGEVDIGGSSVVVPDLLVFDERVLVALDGRSTSEGLLAGIAALPPLEGRDPGSAVDLSGEARVTVDIEVPIRHTDDTTVAGAVTLADNRARLIGQEFVGGQPLGLEGMRATVGFTKTDTTVSGSGRLLGRRAHFEALLTPDRWSGALRTRAPVGDWLAEAGAADLGTILDGEAMVTVGKSSDAPLRLSSELVGVQVALPAPLGKGRTERLPVRVTLGEEEAEIDYGSGLMQVRAPVGGAPGGVRVGINQEPPEDGGQADMTVEGRARDVDLDEWVAFLASGDGGGGTFRARLDLEDATLLGRENARARIDAGTRADGGVSVSIDSDHVAGTVVSAPDDRGETVVTADLDRIGIGKKEEEGEEDEGPRPDRASEPEPEPENFPRLPRVVLTAREVEVGNRRLGQVSLEGGPQGAVWALERLETESDGHRITASGASTMEGAPHSRVDFDVTIDDTPVFIDSWGGDSSAIAGGVASIGGSVTWGNSLLHPETRSMDGRVGITARATRVMKGGAGFLKLLQLITPDLFLSLGFSETLREGILFDTIEGGFDIRGGSMSTGDFVASAPDLTVELSGSTDLHRETLDFRGRVRPGVAAVNALIGVSLLTAAPATALVGWLAQKIFAEPMNAIKEPLADIGAYEYTVKGTWDAPEYTEVAAGAAAGEDQ